MSETTDIAIVGAGGLGKETAVLIGQINRYKKTWNLIGFFDDGIPSGKKILSLPVLGGVNELNAVRKPLHVIIAIGSPLVKAHIIKQINNPNVLFPVLVHPFAVLGQQIKLGEGTVVTAGCVLTVDVRVGKHVLLNLNTTLGHDVTVGDYSSVMPGAHLSGFVTLGQSVFIGTGASVLQHITIEDGAVVGAGAVVTKSVKKNKTVVGVPARYLKPKFKIRNSKP